MPGVSLSQFGCRSWKGNGSPSTIETACGRGTAVPRPPKNRKAATVQNHVRHKKKRRPRYRTTSAIKKWWPRYTILNFDDLHKKSCQNKKAATVQNHVRHKKKRRPRFRTTSAIQKKGGHGTVPRPPPTQVVDRVHAPLPVLRQIVDRGHVPPQVHTQIVGREHVPLQVPQLGCERRAFTP